MGASLVIRTFGAAAAAAAVLAAGSLPACGAEKAVQVQMSVEGRGLVVLELQPKDAPKTVAQIVRLCKTRFYDGILVHRVVPGFVVQAGDPKTKTLQPQELATMSDQKKAELRIGSGGSGNNIPFETNSKTHMQGTLGMALSAPRSDTGDSQWFINLEANHQLDGDYCVFGKVTKGMDVVRKIRVGDRIKSMRVVEPTPGKTKPAKR